MSKLFKAVAFRLRLSSLPNLRLLLLSTGLILSGCSSTPQSALQNMVGDAGANAIDFLTQETKDAVLTPEEIEALPYAAIYARLDEYPQALLILSQAEYAGDQLKLKWVSATGEVVESINGKVVATRGFNLTNIWWSNTDWADKHIVDLRRDNLTERIIIANDDEHGINNQVWFDNTGAWQKTRQWLSPELGYLNLEVVKPFNGMLQNTPVYQPMSVAPPKGLPTATVNVQVAAPNVAEQNWQAWFLPQNPAQPRLSQVINAYMQQANTPTANFYAPLTRLYSDKLDARFNAKHAGMATQLKLLITHYQNSNQPELQDAAQKLYEAFISWPLRGSYVHGFDAVKAQFDLGQNPLLHANEQYTVYLQQAPEVGMNLPSVIVGLHSHSAAGKDWVYVIDAVGRITKIPFADYHSSRKDKQMLQQPGAIIFFSIADSDLPPGFKNINRSLAQFLREWQHSANVNGTP